MTDFLGPIEHFFEEIWASLPTKTLVPVKVAPIAPVALEAPPAPREIADIKLTKQNWPSQHTVWNTYPHPGTANWTSENLTDVKCPWTLHMDKIVLHSIQINKHAAESLDRVLRYIWEKAGSSQETIEKLHYDRYSGSYNYRPIRGASALSMHAYGLAIDFDDQENQQHATKHLFQDNSLIVQAFKAEGWAWGGDWSKGSIDAMHFQAATVY
jgi:hypothetical protein